MSDCGRDHAARPASAVRQADPLKMFASAIIVVVGALVMEVLPSILTAWERCAIWRRHRPCVRIRKLSKRVMLLPHPAWVGDGRVEQLKPTRCLPLDVVLSIVVRLICLWIEPRHDARAIGGSIEWERSDESVVSGLTK